MECLPLVISHFRLNYIQLDQVEVNSMENKSSEGQQPNATVTSVMNLTGMIMQKMADLPKLPYYPCIYKIPRDLRSVNEKSYTPCRVAIGPYHADDPSLKPMEQCKLRCLKALISKGSLQLEDYVAAISSKKIVDEARQCYAEIQELNSDRFAEMLLTDGAFIIEFFLVFFDSVNDRHHLRLLKQNDRMTMEVMRDLLLLENQLPFFILERLFDITFPGLENTASSLGFTASSVLCDTLPIERSNFTKFLSASIQKDKIKRTQIMHLVHLMIIVLQEQKNREEIRIHDDDDVRRSDSNNDLILQASISATDLHEAGVTFKRIATTSNSHGLLNIRFSDGVLEMHHLTLDELTESFFRNLMAFEQYYLNTFEVTSYMYFMDHLIDTVRDVHILQKQNVVENWLESKDNVTAVFNSISKHTITSFSPELCKVIKEMKDYAVKPQNKWKAKLRRDYFGTPWAVISFLAAVTLLVLTFIQTFASFIHPNN